ncbi:MAG TPA: class I SAM-dependent methyltransferase [Candidatus Saccharimonadales bacterium]|nr:class I SAM-dependent methyltransferase [Candidatus Saccharimonadales bacterium]
MSYDTHGYDNQARNFAKFAETSFSWLYIETPAMDEALAGYYERGDEIQVLDVGCGAGRTIRHLIKNGVAPENITGLDPSVNMIELAAEELPQTVSLVMGDAAEMPYFSDESFDLVVANMVLHAMDSRKAEAAIKRIGEVLAPGGDFFLIDSNPKPEAQKNVWATAHSPWGTDLTVFNHDMEPFLREAAPRHGLVCTDVKLLGTSEDGLEANPAEYARYDAGKFRLSAMLHKPEAALEADGATEEQPTA